MSEPSSKKHVLHIGKVAAAADVTGKAASITGVAPALTGLYRPLFQVEFLHGYYDLDGGRCPDLRVIPSPTTVDLMASLGLVFKDRGIGFGVYVDQGSIGGLVKYLRLNNGLDGFWSRLSFALVAVNPLLISISAMPIDTTPTEQNFYASNMSARREKGFVVLADAADMKAESLYNVTDADLPVIVTARTTKVEVRDISGACVLTVDVDNTGKVPVAGINISLSGLPLGLYTVVLVEGNKESDKSEVLYTIVRQIPIYFLDILFTKPRKNDAGSYPVPPLFDGDPPPEAVGNVTYQMQFTARSTLWRYYVASRIPGGCLSDLRIEGQGASFRQDPQHPVILPTGQPAICFVTDDLLPLRQGSPQRFRLSGRRQCPDGRENPIRIDCLPVAPANPVWPAKSTATGISEMYVYV